VFPPGVGSCQGGYRIGVVTMISLVAMLCILLQTLLLSKGATYHTCWYKKDTFQESGGTTACPACWAIGPLRKIFYCTGTNKTNQGWKIFSRTGPTKPDKCNLLSPFSSVTEYSRSQHFLILSGYNNFNNLMIQTSKIKGC